MMAISMDLLYFNKMIDGMSMSEIQQIKQNQISHYRKLNQIFNDKYTKFSQLEPSLLTVINNRKNYHVQIRLNSNDGKAFRIIKENDRELSKENETQRQKLKMIKFGKSRYHVQHQDSLSGTKGHHFYLRKKRDYFIQTQNPEIAKRIINAHGSIDLNKSNIDFDKSRRMMHMLEKYPIAKRMEEYSSKRILTVGIDTQYDNSVAKKIVVRRHKSSKFG